MTTEIQPPFNDSLTHRCGWCEQEVEHYQQDMCTSCGRCKQHCVGGAGHARIAQFTKDD